MSIFSLSTEVGYTHWFPRWPMNQRFRGYGFKTTPQLMKKFAHNWHLSCFQWMTIFLLHLKWYDYTLISQCLSHRHLVRSWGDGLWWGHILLGWRSYTLSNLILALLFPFFSPLLPVPLLLLFLLFGFLLAFLEGNTTWHIWMEVWCLLYVMDDCERITICLGINIGSGNGLLLSGSKPLSESMLTLGINILHSPSMATNDFVNVD